MAVTGCGPPAAKGITATPDPLLGGGAPAPRTDAPKTVASGSTPTDAPLDIRSLPNPNPPPSTAALTVGMDVMVDTAPKLTIGTDGAPGRTTGVDPGVWQKQGAILHDPIPAPAPGGSTAGAGSFTPAPTVGIQPRIDDIPAAKAWLEQHGITLYRWEADIGKAGYRFYCSVPDPTPQDPNRRRNYQYFAADELTAARAVIDSIARGDK